MIETYSSRVIISSCLKNIAAGKLYHSWNPAFWGSVIPESPREEKNDGRGRWDKTLKSI